MPEVETVNGELRLKSLDPVGQKFSHRLTVLVLAPRGPGARHRKTQHPQHGEKEWFNSLINGI
jgi:hypothetical protein